MAQDLTTKQASSVAEFLLAYASAIWEEAGCEYDFCVQHFGEDTIVFGSTNRVIWSVKRGFSIDRSYCTAQFQAAFDRLYPHR